ncbi:MAG: hypothetical protein CMJ31_14785 [Phycisphaerae bacterium]|nr:hypothetical protein [Phycisphaerae bacterium]
MKTISSIALAVFAGAATAGSVDVTVNANANGSAEIRPAGVREFSGAVSTAFWNVEPGSEGQFATIAVMQFNAAAVANAAAMNGLNAVENVTFSLFQDPAGFTSPTAQIDFYYGANDLPMTLGGLTGVNFSNALTQFGAQQIVSDYQFVQGGAGTNDIIDLFGQGLAGQAAFEADLLAGGTITILAVSDFGNASWGGAENIRGFADPSLTVSLVPAPAGAAVLGLGGLVATRRRRA